MKVYVAIILALVAGASADPADQQADPATCLSDLNDLTEGYEAPKSVKKLVSDVEKVINLPKLIEANLGLKYDDALDAARFMVAISHDKGCEAIETEMDKLMDQTKICLPKLNWISRQNLNEVMSGNFGTFLRYVYACAVTKKAAHESAF